MTHLDLFAGIGGFSIAAQAAGFRTVCFVEIDPFCQEVLKARFGAVKDTERVGCTHRGDEEGGAEVRGLGDSGPGDGDGVYPQAESRFGAVGNSQSDLPDSVGSVPQGTDTIAGRSDGQPLLIPDIFTFDGTRFRGATLLTGGFPCQPFSHAGKRRGKEDDRAIWPQMLRVIHEARPAWVIGENVSGLISMELDSVLADLEMEGYATRTFHIGAVGVNAPHRRMRVWIVAHRPSVRCESGERMDTGERVGQEQERPHPAAIDSDAPDAEGRKTQPPKPGGLHSESGGEDQHAPDAELYGREDGPGHAQGGTPAEGREMRRGRPGDNSWDIPWIEVATRFCRVDDGLPAWIHARRVARLKALGNAIVPAVAHEIIKAIADIERGMK